MKILYLAAEVAPFIKTGGLADVAGALPKILARDHEVCVMLPLYEGIAKEWRDQMQFVGSAYVELSWRRQYCGIFLYESENVKYYFLDNEYYFKRREIYGCFDDAERFAFFSKAALDVLKIIEFSPDVLNANDWHSALSVLYVKLLYQNDSYFSGIKTVFTIHNIQYQGQFEEKILDDVLSLGHEHYDDGVLRFHGGINLMKGAIECADYVTTVSPTYAHEICTPYFAHGLHEILEQNKAKLTGILNGIDTKVFDPKSDRHLFYNYDIGSAELKKENKRELKRLLGLRTGGDMPMISMIGRLVSHKGLDLVESVIDSIASEDASFVVLGTGDFHYEEMFRNAQVKYPGKVSANLLFSSDLAGKIYAASDIFLMPSQSEPCGLAQMIAMRYGAVPVVRETGGLNDTVFPADTDGHRKNGFTFKDYNAGDMLYVLREALSLYRDKKAWDALVQAGMSGDYSFDVSAMEYLKIYKKLAE